MAKMEDDALFSSLRDKLFTAVVGDVLDKLGWRRRFLPQAVGPIRPDMKIVGRAVPVLEADVFDEGSGSRGPLGGKPFGLMLEALDDLRPNEVYVATEGSFRYALWGELMSTRARYLRAAGAVLNGFVPGYSRDRDARLPDILSRSLCAGTGSSQEWLSTSARLLKSKGPYRARRPDLRRSRGRARCSRRSGERSGGCGSSHGVHREQGCDRHSGRHECA